MDLTKEQEDIIYDYCCNDMKKLKKLCNPIIVKIGGISKKDYDDIYSQAQMLLYKCITRYDKNNAKNASFNTFFCNILNRRIYYTYIRDRNRQCRSNTKEGKNGEKIFIPDVSLDAPTPDCVAMLDKISASSCLEDEIFKPNISEKVKKYLNNLSHEQLEVAHLFMEGCRQDEIKDILNITQTELNNRINGMKAYRNVSILF